MRLQVAALRRIERGLAAPFVFLGVALAVPGSVEASPVTWAASLGLLIAGAWMAVADRATMPGLLSVFALGYGSILVLNNALVSPAYTPAAPFHAAFLAAGLIVGLRMDRDGLRTLLGMLALGAGVLAGWGLWQVYLGTASRASAYFETPATLAAVLNFALLPVLVRLAVSGPQWSWLALGVLLSAGHAATVSRGGLIALLSGLLVALFCIRRAGLPFSRRGGAAIALVLLVGWVFAQAAGMLSSVPRSEVAVSQQVLGVAIGDAAQGSSVSRLELYELALDGARGHWATGIGYLGFRSLLDANRDAVPSFTGGDTYFVHNDYLQTLLELGIPGFMALAGVVLLPLLVAPQRFRSSPDTDRQLGIGTLAAIAAMATHAAVDFPFYVPLCLLLFGVAVGILDGLVGLQTRSRFVPAPATRRLTAIATAAVAALVLGPPLVADLSAAHAHRAWRNADGQAAAYWFEVARRFEPRDWRYHWYAGQFWYVQAEQTGKPAAARLAEASFAAGVAANPIEVRNHLGRIATHRRFAELLESPAGTDTTRKWVADAAALAPHHPGVRAELARLGSRGVR